MKFSVTHLRIGILVLNLALTVLIGAQALYAVFHQPQFPQLSHRPASPDLRDTAWEKGGPTQDLPAKATMISRILTDRPAAPVMPTEDDGKKADEPPPLADDVPLPPGPLNEGWELSLCIVDPDPQKCWCVLQKRDPSSQPGGSSKSSTSSKISSRINRPPIRSPGGKIQRIPGMAQQTDKKTLRVRDQWVDEDLKINIWVIDVKLDRDKWLMVYEDGSDPRKPQYALVKRTSTIYKEEDGKTKIVKKEESPDPNHPEPKAEKHFHFEAIDRDKIFEERKATAAADTAGLKGPQPAAGSKTTAPGVPGAAHPANKAGRPLSREEERRKAAQTMGELRTNEKFQRELKNLSEKDRRMLESLGGAKK